MSLVTLYLILAQATLTSFSGFGSLAQVRRDLVVERQVLSDEGLNRSVLVARTLPGPYGSYVVSVGYQVAGVEGAIAGWLALTTPALLAIPVLLGVRRVMNHPRVRGAVDALIFASALLVVLTGITLARELLRQIGLTG